MPRNHSYLHAIPFSSSFSLWDSCVWDSFTIPLLFSYNYLSLSLLIVLRSISKPSSLHVTLNSSEFIGICFVTLTLLLSFLKLIFCGNSSCSLLFNSLHFLIYFVVVDKDNVYLWLPIIYINSLHDRANFFNYFIPISHYLKTESSLF